MKLFNVNGVCTAYQIHAFGDYSNHPKQLQLNFLKSDHELTRLCAASDFALIWSINTKEQQNDKSFELLGFTQCFEAKKTHERSREKSSGALKMWCIQPWVLEENRQRLIKKIEEELNPHRISNEEINRRMGFKEFLFQDISNSDLWKGRFIDNHGKIKSNHSFPVGLENRRVLFDKIKDMTGGFEPKTDPIICRDISHLTWGTIKERALMYRRGEI